MKNFFMYSIILVVALFLGFSTYYFLSNNEIIKLNISESDTVKLNIQEKIDVSSLIMHKNARDNTVITVTSSNTDILSYDSQNNILTAQSAGTSVVTITSSNKRFGPFVFNVTVGNGLTPDLPLFIDSAEDLKNIGTKSDWKLSYYYEIIKDIYLTDYENWSPIGNSQEFTGTLNGGHFTIYNLKITSTQTNAGLFSILGTTAKVQNLKVSNANLNGNFDNLGVVAGTNYGTISNCEITDSILVNNNNSGSTGAICGKNSVKDNVRAKIGMCGAENIEFTTRGNTGGLVGLNQGSLIENAYAIIKNASCSSNFGGIVGCNKASSTENFAVVEYTYAINNTSSSLASNFGGIIGYADDLTSNSSINLYKRNLFYANTENAVAKQNETNKDTFSSTQFQKQTLANMKLKKTYTDSYFDFTTIWTMDTQFAKLNFKNAYIPSDIDPVNPIDDPTNPDEPVVSDYVFDLLKDMKNNPTSTKTFTIIGNYTVDFSEKITETKWKNEFGTVWTPIGSQSSPFNWNIRVANGSSFIIKNFVVASSDNAGFFGVVGTSAIINGFTFENITVSSSDNYNAGAIAGYNQGYIKNCSVNGLKVSGTKTVGGAVGTNFNSLNNITITSTNTSSVKGASSGTMQNVGGLAGSNYYSISSSTVSNIEIVGSNNSYNVGGIVGLNEYVISNSSSNNVTINVENSSNVQAGLIAGYNNSKITTSTSKNSKINANTSSSVIGGISAVNSVNAQITNCSIANPNLQGYTVGGIVASNYGTISEVAVGDSTYNVGTLTGVYVGGLVNTNFDNSKVTNSCVLSNIVASSVGSGLVNYLKTNARVTHSYSVASLSGSGELNADTATDYRSVLGGIGQWFINTFTGTNSNCGFIEQCLLVNVNNNYIQGIMIPLDLIPNGLMYRYDIVMSMEQAKGENNYSVYVEKEFDSSVWDFSSTNKLPTLKNNPSIK